MHRRSFDNIRTAYKLLGEILGAEERAGEIATYLERVYNDVTAATADIPDSEKVRLYYAEGPLGLQTRSPTEANMPSPLTWRARTTSPPSRKPKASA